MPDIPTASLQALLAPSTSGWMPNAESSFYRLIPFLRYHYRLILFFINSTLQSLCRNIDPISVSVPKVENHVVGPNIQGFDINAKKLWSFDTFGIIIITIAIINMTITSINVITIDLNIANNDSIMSNAPNVNNSRGGW